MRSTCTACSGLQATYRHQPLRRLLQWLFMPCGFHDCTSRAMVAIHGPNLWSSLSCAKLGEGFSNTPASTRRPPQDELPQQDAGTSGENRRYNCAYAGCAPRLASRTVRATIEPSSSFVARLARAGPNDYLCRAGQEAFRLQHAPGLTHLPIAALKTGQPARSAPCDCVSCCSFYY